VRLDIESAGWNSVPDLVRIVRDELPATVTFDLWIAGERVWPTEEQLAARTGQLPRRRTPAVSRSASVATTEPDEPTTEPTDG
jgi:hypothetical protein